MADSGVDMNDRICAVPDCGKLSIRAWLCTTHARRWRLYGTLTPPDMRKKPHLQVACRGGGCTASLSAHRDGTGLCKRCYRRKWWMEHREQESMVNRSIGQARRAAEIDPDIERLPVEAYWAILEEHGMVCHICREEISDMSELHFDHVIPLSKLGPHHPDNIRPAHATCNLRKGARLTA